jgi:GT2 family glycosyltransferase
VSSRQVPWDDAPWREVQRLARTFDGGTRSYDLASGSPPLFSNAASCVRRSAWQAEPFTLPAAEDMEWAERAITSGWTIAYEGRAAVFHSHEETPREQARRLIDIHRVIGGERRTPLRTLREASRFVYVDAMAILRLDDPLRRKWAHLADLLQTAAFYLRDFSRSGTTAERRREDARTPA